MVLTPAFKRVPENDAKAPLTCLLGSKLSNFKFWPQQLPPGVPKMAPDPPKRPKIKFLTSQLKSAPKNDAKTPLTCLLGSKLSNFKFWPQQLPLGVPKMAPGPPQKAENHGFDPAIQPSAQKRCKNTPHLPSRVKMQLM